MDGHPGLRAWAALKAGAPALDLLRASIRQNARATASCAYLAGREGALCECYHSLGWGATLQDLRLIADHLLLLGIRFLVPHGVFASAHGLRQHDAPPSIGPQMPWWPLFHLLSRRVARVLAHLDGPADAEVALLDPSPGLPTQQQASAYEALQQALLEAHIDWIVVDNGNLHDAATTDGVLRLRDLHIRVVLVPPMRLIDPQRRQWLDDFRAAGGTVVEVARRWRSPARWKRSRPRSNPRSPAPGKATAPC